MLYPPIRDQEITILIQMWSVISTVIYICGYQNLCESIRIEPTIVFDGTHELYDTLCLIWDLGEYCCHIHWFWERWKVKSSLWFFIVIFLDTLFQFPDSIKWSKCMSPGTNFNQNVLDQTARLYICHDYARLNMHVMIRSTSTI